MQRDPRLSLLELKRLLAEIRKELQRTVRNAKPVVTDKPKPDDTILTELGQGQWRRFIVHREQDN
jgi:hypothetical protein